MIIETCNDTKPRGFVVVALLACGQSLYCRAQRDIQYLFQLDLHGVAGYVNVNSPSRGGTNVSFSMQIATC